MLTVIKLNAAMLSVVVLVDVNGSGKHSSLLRYGKNYGRKKFIVQTPVIFLDQVFKKSSSVACTINIATIVNYTARGVKNDHSIISIVPIL